MALMDIVSSESCVASDTPRERIMSSTGRELPSVQMVFTKLMRTPSCRRIGASLPAVRSKTKQYSPLIGRTLSSRRLTLLYFRFIGMN